MRSVGWPSEVKTARSATPRTLLIAALILSAVSVSTTMSLLTSLTEFSPLTPDTASSTLLLREVEVDAWKLRLQSFVDLLDELVLGHTLAPFLCRLERGKKFGVEEAGGIGAVIGPSLLGYDRLDFGKIPDHQPHAVDEVITLLERDRRRHGCANPEIALLEVRQEFEAQ